MNRFTLLVLLLSMVCVPVHSQPADMQQYIAEGTIWGNGETIITMEPFVVASGDAHQKIAFIFGNVTGRNNLYRFEKNVETGRQTESFDELDNYYTVTIYNDNGFEETHADLTADQLAGLEVIAPPGNDKKVYCRLSIRVNSDWGDDAGQYSTRLQIKAAPAEIIKSDYAPEVLAAQSMENRLRGRNIKELRPAGIPGASRPEQLRQRLRKQHSEVKKPRTSARERNPSINRDSRKTSEHQGRSRHVKEN